MRLLVAVSLRVKAVSGRVVRVSAVSGLVVELSPRLMVSRYSGGRPCSSTSLASVRKGIASPLAWLCVSPAGCATLTSLLGRYGGGGSPCSLSPSSLRTNAAAWLCLHAPWNHRLVFIQPSMSLASALWPLKRICAFRRFRRLCIHQRNPAVRRPKRARNRK